MRLLHLNDDGELCHAEYIGNIPRYAILSHTWGADNEEVTFKDLTEGAGKSKAGYSKILFCINQAAKDDLKFVWVDTCCIDKSSSTELSEAINSMFQWYQRADKCYVYLTDIFIGDPAQSDLPPQQTWKSAFRQSKWFTRGWTLQELLAPKYVQFFSADGKLLGDKLSLAEEIHETSRVPLQTLEGSPLSHYSVDERMLWSKNRKTKREEDAAYSLLGIFNIHMPLLYGEGREKAFIRLRKKIDSSNRTYKEEKKSAQQSPSIKPLVSSTVPFRRDDDFISRDSLEKLRQICAKPAARAALVGLGGVGKSQLAIEHTYQLRDASPTTWVFWVHAATRTRFEEGYRRIAEATKMDGWNNPKADILRLVRSWLCDESNGKWLMVVDNADDSSVFFHDTTQTSSTNSLDQPGELLSDFLPQSPNGTILVTSRSQDTAYKLVGTYSNIIEVKPMDKDDALALLRRKLGFVDNDAVAVELIHALDAMPLAITQAAAFIKQRAPRMTISRYLDEIRKNDSGRTRLLRKDVRDSRRDGQASNSVITTWQISFEHLREKIPNAARLLSLMSLFDRQGIPEQLLHDRYADDSDDEADFEDDVYALTSFSLVEISADGHEFEMHRLVQFSTRKWLELQGNLETWKGNYIKLMDDNYPDVQYENWKTCQLLFPHAQAALTCRPTNSDALEAWAAVLFRAAWYADDMGNYKVAQEMGEAALEARESTLGAEHPDTLTSVSNLGVVLEGQGKYEEAEAMHRRALEGQKKTIGPEHPNTLNSLNNLGLVLENQGKYEEAESMHRRALECRRKVLGAEHSNTLNSLNNLGSVLESQGKYEEAEAVHRRALEGREKVLGAEHPNTFNSLNNLALVLEGQGKYEEAESMHRRALNCRTKLLGAEHPNTLNSLNNLGAVLESQGKYKEAEAMHRQVLEVSQKVLGAEHPNTLNSLNNLGLVLENQGKYEEAESVHRQSLEGSQKVLGAEHPHTLTSVGNLGLLLESQGKYEEAETMHRRALEGQKEILGAEHPRTLTSVHNLGCVLKSQGRYEEAKAMHQRALEGREKTLGTKHPDTLDSLNNLASLLKIQGKNEEDSGFAN